MTSRPGERGRSKMARRLLAAGLTMAMGYTFGVLTLGGCAGASWPSNGKLPQSVVEALTECGKKGPTPLQSANYDLAFLVHVTEGTEEARVDGVKLMSSTLHLDEVEACMADALYGMRTPLEALALRRRNLSPGPPFAPETRALLGQAQAVQLLEIMALIVVGYAVYTVVVHVLEDRPRTKPRPRPARPETEEPPAPASALPTATAAPVATAVPISTAVPIATTAADADVYEKRCWPLYQECLKDDNQPEWNQKNYGKKKHCQACYQECKFHSRPRGTWPNYKCPRK